MQKKCIYPDFLENLTAYSPLFILLHSFTPSFLHSFIHSLIQAKYVLNQKRAERVGDAERSPGQDGFDE